MERLEDFWARQPRPAVQAFQGVPDAAAELGHFHAAPCQPRKHVFELRQFHLQLAFAASCVFCKNIQNQLGAINDTALGKFLDIALLNGREIRVENYQRSFFEAGFRADLLQLALSNKGGGIGRRPQLKYSSSNFRAGAAREFLAQGREPQTALLQNLRAKALLFPQDTQKQVFGANVTMPQAFGLFRGEIQDALGFLAERNFDGRGNALANRDALLDLFADGFD